MLLGHPPPPPPPVFPRRHPAELLMTPPGAPLAPSDHVTPTAPMTSTPQVSSLRVTAGTIVASNT